jgi:hypothetical protein
MSLGVNLERKKWVSYDEGKTHTVENEEVYWANITHNLGEMAGKAGIYEALWRPYLLRDDYKEFELYGDNEYEFENKCVIKASDIIDVLEKGLADLKKRPKYFEKFNSDNGWGMYHNFVPFVDRYLNACKEYPECVVKVSR